MDIYPLSRLRERMVARISAFETHAVRAEELAFGQRLEAQTACSSGLASSQNKFRRVD
jgi:hypothetical protein